ncbi:MAG: hypothetical protein HND52_07115 [Ignavibacteriae bacterium]|nr:hypothetical protein [Ignavibacteriota bacterium]NOG97714.1 hypothetical protein [Ignavibacteriota bacterium]
MKLTINQVIYYLVFIFLFANCQVEITKPTSTPDNEHNQLTNSFYKIPDTYVHGIVYKGRNPQCSATVQLLDEEQSVLAQTYTNNNGYYSIMICPYGYGDRTVKAIYFDSSWQVTLTTSENFVFSYATAYPDFDYEIDLQLIPAK